MAHPLAQLAMNLAGGLLPPAQAAKRTALGGIVIGIFLLTAYVAALVAVFFALSPVLGPAQAALAIAGGALVAALIAWGVVTMMNRRAEERARLAAAERQLALQSSLAQGALSTLPALVRDHPFLSMLVAAGLVFAMSPGHKDKDD